MFHQCFRSWGFLCIKCWSVYIKCLNSPVRNKFSPNAVTLIIGSTAAVGTTDRCHKSCFFPRWQFLPAGDGTTVIAETAPVEIGEKRRGDEGEVFSQRDSPLRINNSSTFAAAFSGKEKWAARSRSLSLRRGSAELTTLRFPPLRQLKKAKSCCTFLRVFALCQFFLLEEEEERR